MAMQFMDGFDYLIAANVGLKWDAAVGFGLVSPGAYGKGKAIGASNNVMVKTLTSNFASGYMAFHLEFASFSSANVAIAAFRDAGTTQVDIRYDATGAMYFTRNGTTIGSVAATQYRLSPGQYYWIELQVDIHSTLGQANLYINANSVLTQTGLNTQATANQFFNQVAIIGNNSGVTFDNFHFWDPSAGDVHTFPYGEHIIETTLANGVGTHTSWNKGGSTINANNYQQVNEANEDGDTTYVYMSSSGAGDIDSYVFADIPETTGTIGTVAINVIVRIDDAGPHTYEHYTLSSGSSAVSSAQTPGANYDNIQTFQGKDPNTSTAWTIVGLNAAEFGYEFIS